jgi:hypothetical protein
MNGDSTPGIPAEHAKLLEEYCTAMKSHFGERLKSICLFGSVAKGRPEPESDVDVLVVAEGLPPDVGGRMSDTSEVREAIRKSRASKTLRASGRSTLISEVFLTPEEVRRHPPILLDMIDEGIILHDEDGFLEKELETIRKRLKELGARKVITSKGHYWILKPDIKPGEVVEI